MYKEHPVFWHWPRKSKRKRQRFGMHIMTEAEAKKNSREAALEIVALSVIAVILAGLAFYK